MGDPLSRLWAAHGFLTHAYMGTTIFSVISFCKSRAHLPVTLLLLLSLSLSSVGFMVCLHTEDRTETEITNLLVGCVDDCHLPESAQADSAFDDRSCVDYLIPALLTIRPDKSGFSTDMAAPVVMLNPHWISISDSEQWQRTSSQSDPPNRPAITSLQSTILLI